jgi:GTPase
MDHFKSGFVNIIGYPNAGKSTLFNQLLGDKISIVTPKVQTTRQRILGLLNGENYQVVFSDTPGIVDPKYQLHHFMIKSIEEALEDADVILYIVDAADDVSEHEKFIGKIKKLEIPYYLLVNKMDLQQQEKMEVKLLQWQELVPKPNIYPISALYNFNLKALINEIIRVLPEHEPYYPDDIITDKSERFIASEIIREKIFIRYKQEIPYSVEVIITEFKEGETLLRILADIVVSKESHKPIIIGKKGVTLKHIGIDARKDMEAFFKKQVYLELYVKVREGWKDNKNLLRQFGYE